MIYNCYKIKKEENPQPCEVLKEDVSPACFARSVNYANLCSKWRSRSCPPAIFGPFSQVRISLQ